MADETTALAQFTGKEIELIKKIEDVVSNTEVALLGATGKITKTFALARGVQALREYITPEMMQTYVMPLMNTPLGFKTDKDPKRGQKQKDGTWKNPEPYSQQVVKDCVITVMLRGGQLVGNEFNIISGQAYFTKEYFMRVLGQIPGVTNIVPSPGIPRIEGSKALIRYGLSWKKNGVSDCLKDAEGKPGRAFEIRCDSYSSVDQIIGKADRKAYAAAYRQIMGSELAIPDGDADELIEGQVVAPSEPPAKTGVQRTQEAIARKHAEEAAAQASKPQPVVHQQQQTEEEPQQVDDDRPTNVDDDGVIHDAPNDDAGDSQTSDAPVENQQQNPPQQGSAPKGDDVTTYASFLNIAESIVATKNIPESDFSRGVSMALISCGCKGKADKTTLDWRTKMLAALRADKLDWQTGKILP